MTHTELVTEVLRERGLSDEAISQKLKGGNMLFPNSIANAEIVLRPGCTITQLKAGIHQAFDNLDKIPKHKLAKLLAQGLKDRRHTN